MALETKMKVFISVPMRGRSKEEIDADITRAMEKLRTGEPEIDFTFVDNMIDKPDETERLYCLGEAVKKLGECDSCFFCKGWEEAPGCNVEHMVCDCYNIMIFEEV